MTRLSKALLIAVALGATGGGLGALIAGCAAPVAARPDGLLLITLDTIRADRIGAYGYRDVETPFIDDLAKRGVLFERAIAPVPLTLPSHTSLLTGTYPPRHGVRDNGDFEVPQELETLAELLRAQGFRTGAFVGAFVLDRRWGLDQGFERYSGEFEIQDISKLVSIGDVQRRADEVMDDALAWLEDIGQDEPFFAWVHVFDPHDPYDPPSPYRERYEGRPYIGEIAYSDAQLARLGEWLEASGRSETTLVVFAGDHGEGLDDHGEFGHGLFLYQEAVHVPLIVVDPLAGTAGSRRPEPVSLVDVFPTLCERFALAVPDANQGRSLIPLLGRGGTWQDRPVYSETYYPYFQYGWSPLTSIQDRRYHYIESSEAELYDLEKDPDQRVDLAASEPAVLRRLEEIHDSLLEELARDAIQEGAAPDAETVAKLSALGYVSGASGVTVPTNRSGLAPPRRRIDVYNRLVEARAALTDGDLDTAEERLGTALAGDPEVAETYSLLGRLRLRQGRLDEAEETFSKGLELKPDDLAVTLGLATARLRSGRVEKALAVLERAAERRPTEAWPMVIVASFARQAGRLDTAADALERALELDPDSPGAHLEMGVLELGRGAFTRAERLASRALDLDPRLRGAHLCRAQSLEAQGRLEAARAEYRAERELAPGDHRPVYGLARLEGRLGDSDEERRLLEETIRLEPGFAPAYLYLARNLMVTGGDYRKAISLVQRALEQKPTGSDLALAYYLLADLYNRVGDQGLSNDYATKGREAERRLSLEEGVRLR